MVNCFECKFLKEHIDKSEGTWACFASPEDGPALFQDDDRESMEEEECGDFERNGLRYAPTLPGVAGFYWFLHSKNARYPEPIQVVFSSLPDVAPCAKILGRQGTINLKYLRQSGGLFGPRISVYRP